MSMAPMLRSRSRILKQVKYLPVLSLKPIGCESEPTLTALGLPFPAGGNGSGIPKGGSGWQLALIIPRGPRRHTASIAVIFSRSLRFGLVTQ